MSPLKILFLIFIINLCIVLFYKNTFTWVIPILQNSKGRKTVRTHSKAKWPKSQTSRLCQADFCMSHSSAERTALKIYDTLTVWTLVRHDEHLPYMTLLLLLFYISERKITFSIKMRVFSFLFGVWAWNLTYAGQVLYHWATASPVPICGMLFLATNYRTEQDLSG